MPEGPSLVMLKEAIYHFKGKKVLDVEGYGEPDVSLLHNQTLLDIRTWGKHLLLCFKKFTVRVHLMLFGTYVIDGEKKVNAKLGMRFSNGTLNFYTCSVKIIEEKLDDVYDWEADIMSDEWSAAKAKKKLKEKPDVLVCDALLNQDIFSGSGNIIKNETLFRCRIQPESTIGALPVKQLNLLIKETRKFAFDFLKWRIGHQLNKHLQAHDQETCPRDHVPFHVKTLGKSKRNTFYCTVCQVLYK